VNDEDVQIKVDKGVVYVSISDKMLFSSGSANVTQAARTVLGKVATVLNSKPEIEFIVEGHTDSVPISTECVQDNWDLSVKRATAVARILQRDYKMDPKRITAAGRSSYVPVASNADASGRSLNRRTRIVIQPMLDQFFKLLEPGQQPPQETK
jgi:chemotaxis protein MotB